MTSSFQFGRQYLPDSELRMRRHDEWQGHRYKMTARGLMLDDHMVHVLDCPDLASTRRLAVHILSRSCWCNRSSPVPASIFGEDLPELQDAPLPDFGHQPQLASMAHSAATSSPGLQDASSHPSWGPSGHQSHQPAGFPSGPGPSANGKSAT